MKMTNSILRLRKKPNGRYVEEGRLVEWVDNVEDPAQVRVPFPIEKIYLLAQGFFVDGQPYASLGDLQCHREGDYFFRDRYGHRVLEVRERFPCFDSYDYETENRCIRWFYLVSGVSYGVYPTRTARVPSLSLRMWKKFRPVYGERCAAWAL